MIRAWVSRNVSSVITAVGVLLITLLVATVAIVTDGFSAQRLDLDDGSVWVANGSRQVIGRANTEVMQLNTVVTGSGNDLSVVQDGGTVLLIDRAATRLDIVDPANSGVVDSVALPVNGPAVHLAGENAVVHAEGTGEVWVVARDLLGAFDVGTEPQLSLGPDAALAVTPDGVLFAYSPDSSQLVRVDLSQGAGPVGGGDARLVEFAGERANVSLTVVGDRPVILDASGRQLWVDGTVVDLADHLEAGDSPVLQLPGPGASRVLLATDRALLRVGFDGEVDEVVSGRAGVPAAPLLLDGCVFAGWADGTAWRSCSGSDAVELSLSGGDVSAARLEFARNGDRVVLNDALSGRTWAVQSSGELIDNWDELIRMELDEQEVEQVDSDSPPEFEKAQVPPVAVDDEFGARPGRSTVLPVLLNDHDANGDVLVISEVTQIDDSVGRLDLVRDRQQVQITLTESASGTVSFGYTITDGRGGSASATVTVTVRQPHENSPPVQVRPSQTSVAQGGRVTTNVLGDWVDPDGDPFYLVSAGVAEPDSVSHRPEGAVVFQEGGGAPGSRVVSLVVTDGAAQAAGTLAVTVAPSGDVPIVAEPFAVRTYAGSEVRVSPLEHVRGGTGTLRLSAVPSRPGATITPNLDAGTFRFVSDQVRTFYVEYLVTDGVQTVTGQVRIDVENPPDAASVPVTTPKTVFVRTLGSETINVAALDTDPAGGVLMVTAVSDATGAGVRAEILEQRSVRLTLLAPLDAGPVAVTYTVTNGLASAEGTITVIEIPAPDRLQAPVATDDAVTVRVGDTIDIPVLSNDFHPDREPLVLNPDLVQQPSGSGLLFVAGERLRYLAPDQAGDFTAVYEVAGPDGQTAQAQVRIAVREVVEASNNPPSPSLVTARVTAGGTVKIRIPLTGIDPDGDSVQLLGVEDAPEKGSVTDVGPDFIEYEAGEYSAGTDALTYSVMDTLGARATGRVRVGISPPHTEARNPVATADIVTTRPGGAVSIQVLANDIDPDGGVLSVVSVEPNSPEVTAEIDGDLVVVTPPETPGSYGLVYTIENERGGSSSNFVTVHVDPEAPWARPIAADTVLSLADILDRETVTVNVLQNVFFADGPVSDLSVSLLPGFDENAHVTAGGEITVTVAPHRQIIPFRVTHPNDSSVVAHAFVRMPGLDDALPQIDRRAKPLTVASESRLVIDINDYVVAVGDDGVRITDSTLVRATNANGDPLVVDETTLAFTSADKYFGPASITFEVTDGASADDPEGRRATLVLPIRVTPRENQPPVFTGGMIEFEPSEEKVLDLVRLTNYPYPDDMDELAYRVLEPLPSGFSYTLTGSTLTLRAAPSTPKGTETAITIGVRDGLTDGRAGTISLRVVASNRPLARPAPDSAVTPRGTTTTVDVLANDAATNPFPSQPLRVTAIRGLDGANLPSGVTVVPSADRSRLTVTVASDAEPRDTRLQYQVADATSDPERMVWGEVTISVQDVPDAPAAPVRVGGHVDGALTLRITPPAANNAPITRYEVVSDAGGGYRHDCGLQQLCTLDNLAVGTQYEFRVVAVNALGESSPGPASVPLRVDHLPAAPTGVTVTPTGGAEGELTISWNAVPDPPRGTALTGYTVQVSGPGVGLLEEHVDASTTTRRVSSGIQPGQRYEVVIVARNSAQVTADEWNRSAPAAATAVGRPSTVPVTATLLSETGDIQVGWGQASWNGASSGTYHVGRFVGAEPPATCTPGNYPGRVAGPVTSPWTDADTSDGTRYTYVVYADNGLFCSVSVASPVQALQKPGRASMTLQVGQRDELSPHFDLVVVAPGVNSGVAVRYEYRLNGGAWQPLPESGFVTPASTGPNLYGTSVTVEIRGCRDASDSLCGDPSTPRSATPVTTRATVLSCTAGEEFQPQAPANEGNPTVSYHVQYKLDTAPDLWTLWEPWNPGDTVPEAAEALRIRATVNIGPGYTDPAFSQYQCAQPEETTP